MATYRIFLRTDGELVDRSISTACDSDGEARELAQRMIDDGVSKDARAEVWAGSRFVGAVSSIAWLLGG
jgi:hypothetical protein